MPSLRRKDTDSLGKQLPGSPKPVTYWLQLESIRGLLSHDRTYQVKAYWRHLPKKVVSLDHLAGPGDEGALRVRKQLPLPAERSAESLVVVVLRFDDVPGSERNEADLVGSVQLDVLDAQNHRLVEHALPPSDARLRLRIFPQSMEGPETPTHEAAGRGDSSTSEVEQGEEEAMEEVYSHYRESVAR
ncbi:unnamed protein product [Effrenium voratum]|nr:unnamed protein product [Effrenium voratum]